MYFSNFFIYIFKNKWVINTENLVIDKIKLLIFHRDNFCFRFLFQCNPTEIPSTRYFILKTSLRVRFIFND